MLDAMLGAGAVLGSLLISLAILRTQKHRSADTRGIAGLGISVVHLLLSLALPALVWIVFKPVSQLSFILSVLVFYWLSLIVLVMTIIWWLRAAASAAASSGASDIDSKSRL